MFLFIKNITKALGSKLMLAMESRINFVFNIFLLLISRKMASARKLVDAKILPRINFLLGLNTVLL